MPHPLRLCLTAVVAAACVFPVSASAAATRSVQLGAPPDLARELGKLSADVDAYFPSTTTIRVGDAVRFVPVSYHNVDLPRRGGSPTPQFAPNGATVSETDAAGRPFWFNGRPQYAYSRAFRSSAFGKRLSYDGRRSVQSGPWRDRRTPLTVRFTRRGTFTYHCDIHPGMKGKVEVVPRGRRVPSAAAHRRNAAGEMRRALATARELGRRSAPAGAVKVGMAARGGVEIIQFVPSQLTVRTGDTLTFAMDDRSLEVHTATTGPGSPQEPSSYVGALVAGMQSPLFPGAGTYPSDPPSAGPAALSPSLHGNGFWSSGLLDARRGSPWPASGAVRFTQPGAYRFFCLVHPYMSATVNVS